MRRLVLINLLLLVVLYALAEVAVRQLMPHNQTFDQRVQASVQFLPSGFVQFVASPSQQVLHVEDGRLTEDVRFSINEHGFRGGDISLRKDHDEVRVAIVGGSHIFDIYSFDFEGNVGFPALLETEFRQEGMNVSVMNCGLPGYNTTNITAQILFELPRFSPDIVVINSAWNDLKWISRADSTLSIARIEPTAVRPNPFLTRGGIPDYVLGWSSIYRKLRGAWLRQKYGMSEGIDEGIIASTDTSRKDVRIGLAMYSRNLHSAVAQIRQMNAVPVLAIEERLVSSSNTMEDKRKLEYHYINVRSHEELVDLFAAADSVVHSVAAATGSIMIDVNSEMQGRAEFFADHVHTTPLGSRHMAKRYYELLKPHVVERLPTEVIE